MSGVRLSDTDIVVILANLQSNAMEACEKLHSNKIIKLKLVLENDSLIISVRNPYEGKVIVGGSGISTSKSRFKEEHGIDVKNIIDVINKNDGIYALTVEDQEFCFSTVLPNE